MIHNRVRVAGLIKQMQGHLQHPAFPTKEVIRMYRRRGVKISFDRGLAVRHVFYAGDEGGIVCDVTPRQGANDVFGISLTHPDHRS